MIAIRNITSVGGQTVWQPVVAVGPQPGQLLVAQTRPLRLWVINATDGRLLHTLTLPEPCYWLQSVSALDSGQLLISYSISHFTYGMAVYRSVTDSPRLLTNLTSDSVQDVPHGTLAVGNHFLVPYALSGYLFVLGADGSILHTLDVIKGELGVGLYSVLDVAFWQDCVWLVSSGDGLVLMC